MYEERYFIVLLHSAKIAVTKQTPPPKPTTLRVGEPRPHPPGMPTFLPPFPDPHTYLASEIHVEPAIDHERVRRLAAAQRRAVESSLIAYRLAIQPSVSLFVDYERALHAEAREGVSERWGLNRRSL